MMASFIRQVRAFEGEVVEIAWQCQDGAVFHQRVTVPPKATREAKREILSENADRPSYEETTT